VKDSSGRRQFHFSPLNLGTQALSTQALSTQALSTQALFPSPSPAKLFLFDSYLSNLQFRLSVSPERKTDIN